MSDNEITSREARDEADRFIRTFLLGQEMERLLKRLCAQIDVLEKAYLDKAGQAKAMAEMLSERPPRGDTACPFCGSICQQMQSDDVMYSVVCLACHATGPIAFDEREASALWCVGVEQSDDNSGDE